MSIITGSIYYHGVFRVYVSYILKETKQIQGLIRDHSELYTQEYTIDEKAVDGTMIRQFAGWRYNYNYTFDRLNSDEIAIINWIYKWMHADHVEITFQPDPTDTSRVYGIFSSADYIYNYIAYKTFMDKRGILELQAVDLYASLDYFYNGKTNTLISVSNKYSNGDISYNIVKGDATRLFILGNLEGSLRIYVNGLLKQQIYRSGYFQAFIQIPADDYYAFLMRVVGDLNEHTLFQDRS